MTSFPKKHILQNEGRNYQPKKLFKVKKKDVTVKDKRPLFLFYLFMYSLITLLKFTF